MLAVVSIAGSNTGPEPWSETALRIRLEVSGDAPAPAFVQGEG